MSDQWLELFHDVLLDIRDALREGNELVKESGQVPSAEWMGEFADKMIPVIAQRKHVIE